MLDADFWGAVEGLVQADDSGADVIQYAEDLVARQPALPKQLQEAVEALDSSALARAARLSDGLAPTEDAMLAVACAVLESGPAAYLVCAEDPEALLTAWDLSRGDLLLALNPAVSLAPEPESTFRREPYTINVVLGDSRFRWPRAISEAVTYEQARKVEKTERWRAIFDKHDAVRLVIHLSAAPGRTQRIGKPRNDRDGRMEIDVAWPTPRSPLGLAAFAREVLSEVATTLDGTTP